MHVILAAVYTSAQSKTRWSSGPSPTLLSLPLSHLLGLPHLCPRGSPGDPRHHQLHTHTALPLQLVGCQAGLWSSALSDLVLKRGAGSGLVPRRGLKADTLALVFNKTGFSSNIRLTKLDFSNIAAHLLSHFFLLYDLRMTWILYLFQVTRCFTEIYPLSSIGFHSALLNNFFFLLNIPEYSIKDFHLLLLELQWPPKARVERRKAIMDWVEPSPLYWNCHRFICSYQGLVPREPLLLITPMAFSPRRTCWIAHKIQALFVPLMNLRHLFLPRLFLR